MTRWKTHFTAVCCSELFWTCCRKQKQCSGSAMSLSETSGVPLLGFCDSLRVTHPHVVVIGLLCVDVAVAFWVPQGSGSVSGCGTNRCYGSRIKSVGKKKKQQQQWLHIRGSQRTHSIVDVQVISRLFHELLTANHFCDPHNKNSGDKWRKRRVNGSCGRQSSSHQQQGTQGKMTIQTIPICLRVLTFMYNFSEASGSDGPVCRL